MKDMRPGRNPRASRRRGALAAGGVAVVALAVVIGPHLIDATRISSVANEAAKDAEPDAARLAHPYACPPSGQRPTPARPAAGGAVPRGAVLARICPNGAPDSRHWGAPLDALTTNVDHVADAFDRLASAAPADFICASVQRSAVAFSVTFQYPDGRLVRLDGRRDGCNQVSMQGQPGQARVGASAVLAAYLEALRSQRATLSPPEPTDLPTLRCPAAPANFGPGLLPGERKLDMVEAVVCTYPGAASGRRGSFPLLPAQVRVVDRDYAAHLTRHPAMLFCPLGRGTTAIVGETAWGDRVMTSTSCGPWSRAAVSATPLSWQPSAAASRMLDRVVANPSTD